MGASFKKNEVKVTNTWFVLKLAKNVGLKTKSRTTFTRRWEVSFLRSLRGGKKLLRSRCCRQCLHLRIAWQLWTITITTSHIWIGSSALMTKRSRKQSILHKPRSRKINKRIFLMTLFVKVCTRSHHTWNGSWTRTELRKTRLIFSSTFYKRR